MRKEKAPRNIYKHIDPKSPIRKYLIEIENKYWKSEANQTYVFPRLIAQDSDSESESLDLRDSHRRQKSRKNELNQAKMGLVGRLKLDIWSVRRTEDSLSSLEGVTKYNLRTQNSLMQKRKRITKIRRANGFLSADRKRLGASLLD